MTTRQEIESLVERPSTRRATGATAGSRAWEQAYEQFSTSFIRSRTSRGGPTRTS